MEKYEVYLAGAMEYANDGGVGWRDFVTPLLKDLDIQVFNPASNEHGLLNKMGAGSAQEFLGYKKTDPARFLECMRAIIEYDMAAIDKLDAILVYITKGLSGGTIGEITHAYRNLGIPVFAVLQDGVEFQDVSGWVLGCTTEIFTSFDGAFVAIVKHKELRRGL
jgi:nucleoside 2-deoxyribosyltransferase